LSMTSQMISKMNYQMSSMKEMMVEKKGKEKMRMMRSGSMFPCSRRTKKSLSGFDLLNVGSQLPDEVDFLQLIFLGIYLVILMALVGILLSSFGWSTIGPGISEIISGGAYMGILMFLGGLVSKLEWATIDTGIGIPVVIIGGIMTVIAGVLIKMDQKRLERLKIEEEYHDRDLNIFSMALKHSYSMGRPSQEQVELLDMLKTEMNITEDEAAQIEDEALGPKRGGGRPMERPPPADWDERDDYYDEREYPCPQCGAPLQYIDEYGEWYCDECQEYEMGEDEPPPKKKRGKKGSSREKKKGKRGRRPKR